MKVIAPQVSRADVVMVDAASCLMPDPPAAQPKGRLSTSHK